MGRKDTRPITDPNIAGPAYKNLEKRLLSADRQYAPHDWFRWMLEDVLADLTGGRKSNPPPEAVIDELRELSGLYAHCVIEAQPFADVLGSLYMTLASHGSKKYLGQYFTPAPVAEMMAKIQGLSTEPKPGGGLWRVCDPAAGSGVMLLAAARILYERNPNSLQLWSFTGVDIDRYCSLMCANQLAANALIRQCPVGEIAVYRGDSLGPQTAENFQVVMHAVADPERASVHQDRPALPEPPQIVAAPNARVEADTTTEAETRTQSEDGQLQLLLDR